MDVQHKLIVSPTNVKFQAPFPHNQKRQLSLMNVSDQDLVYSIEVGNEALFKVIPSSGRVDAYDTIELIILMKPVSGSLPTNVMNVKYMLRPEESSEEEQSDQSDETVHDPSGDLSGDWSEAHTSQVHISLENCVENEEELRRMFALDGNAESVARIMERKYQPVCTNCCLKRTNPRLLAKTASWRRLLFWPGCLAAFSVAVYFGCEFLGLSIIDLSSERVF
ncbi:hypothetical protein ACLKA6_000746 [Drosophila palustris]